MSWQPGTQATGPCLEWTGARNGRGYGRKRVGNQIVYAHRWVWEQSHGPIDEGLVIMHLCDNPPCYEVAHLRIGSMAENMADAEAKRPASKTDDVPCPRGHSGPGVFRRVEGRGRECRMCMRLRVAAYRSSHPVRTIDK